MLQTIPLKRRNNIKKLASTKDCGKPNIPEGFPVPTAPLSTNICQGQGGRFVKQAQVPETFTCEEARDGVRPQTGGVSDS